MRVSVLSLLSFAAAAFAQQVVISEPASGASVSPGSTLSVKIDRPPFQSGATEVAIALGIRQCVTTSNGPFCFEPSDGLGTLLYNGPYQSPSTTLTVTIPSTIPLGQAKLNLYHASLIGAGLLPWSETLSIPLTIV